MDYTLPSMVAAQSILRPAIARLPPENLDIRVELNIEQGLTDMVAERFDAGVRLGEQVEKHMIAVRIGADLRMAMVGAPAYFKRRAGDGGRLWLSLHPPGPCRRVLGDGRLVRVLEDWCAPFPGYHLYFPSRRQQSPAFAVLVEALRYRAASDTI